MQQSNNNQKRDRIRMISILFISVLVIITGSLFAWQAISQGDVIDGFLGGLIALIILLFALIVYKRGNQDLKDGLPLKDERSIRVMEKATSKAFYVSLYLLLLVGFLSNDIIRFRDVSQGMGISVGLMALLFLGFWLYYNKREV